VAPTTRIFGMWMSARALDGTTPAGVLGMTCAAEWFQRRYRTCELLRDGFGKIEEAIERRPKQGYSVHSENANLHSNIIDFNGPHHRLSKIWERLKGGFISSSRR
jgi:hypothetical protein